MLYYIIIVQVMQYYWNKGSCPYWIQRVSFSAFVLMWRPWCYVLRSSFEYSCWKRNSLYPIRAALFVSLVLYLIHIFIVWFVSRFYPFNVFFTSTYNPFVFIDTYVLYLRILLIHVYHLFTPQLIIAKIELPSRTCISVYMCFLL